jgi:hypothetical protein
MAELTLAALRDQLARPLIGPCLGVRTQGDGAAGGAIAEMTRPPLGPEAARAARVPTRCDEVNECSADAAQRRGCGDHALFERDTAMNRTWTATAQPVPAMTPPRPSASRVVGSA